MRRTNGDEQDITSIRYTLSWPEPQTHYFHVRIDIMRSITGPVDVCMPAWRPGRYIIQNYARYVVGFEAFDTTGQQLSYKKTDKNTWRVEAGAEYGVVVQYRVYANVLDAGESYLNEREAYVNPISVLMYLHGKEHNPCVLSLNKPNGWNVATPLDFDVSMQGYPAADYHELVDSPFIISPDFEVHAFDHDGARYELVFQGEGNYDPSHILDEVKQIVQAQVDMMGVTPFKRYVFLYHLVPHRFAHGVEHKNSTCIVLGPPDFTDPQFQSRFRDFTAHEFFHVWNVERIRPEAIYYPDYSKEMYTTTMWVYEGITCYYTDLSLLRAGLYTIEQFFEELAGALTRYDLALGRKVTSVAMTSWNSWISSKAPPDTTYSFYLAGHVLGALLDLEIRNSTANRKSLDDVFRYLYTEYAEQDRGVPETGFQNALETIAGRCFQGFFDSYVYGHEAIDYNEFLVHAGLRIQQSGDDSGGYKIIQIADTTALQKEIYESWLQHLSVNI